MQVYFYSNFTKSKNSTKQPAENSGTLYTCLLKDDTTVTAPRIQLKLSSSDPVSFTYAYIPAWNRYYFINEWTYVLGMWEASLSVDVLGSFKTEIGNLSKYVLRSSHSYDPEIPDTFYTTKNPWHTNAVNLPTPFDYANTKQFIVGIISAPSPNAQTGEFQNNSLGAVTYYKATEKEILTIIRWLLSDDFLAIASDPSSGISNAVLKNFSNPLDYISSLTLFPFEIIPSGSFGAYEYIKYGWWDTTNWTGFPRLTRIPSLTRQFVGNDYRVAIPTNSYAINKKDFLKYDPYTKYHLRLEPFGIIPLETNLMAGKDYLYTGYDIDLMTGQCRLSLGTSLYGAELGTYNTNVGIPIALSQITTDIIGGVASIGQSLMSGFGMATGDSFLGGLGGGLLAGITGTANLINTIKPEAQTKGNNGSIIAYNGINNHQLVIRYCDCATTLNSEFGFPLCGYRVLNTIPGFILCGEGHVDVNAYDSEKTMISQYLTGGFFYE